MSAPDVVHGMLTALFAAAALHGLRHGVLSPRSGWRGRVDHVLHAVMALAMAAAPWGRVLPGRAQTAFFVAATLWFPLTAVRRHESRLTVTAGRLPSALGMAAMAWMVRMPHATGESRAADAVTAMLALSLLGYALRSLTRDMPTLRSPTQTECTATPGECYRHFWDGSMALGTAVMLLMPH